MTPFTLQNGNQGSLLFYPLLRNTSPWSSRPSFDVSIFTLSSSFHLWAERERVWTDVSTCLSLFKISSEAVALYRYGFIYSFNKLEMPVFKLNSLTLHNIPSKSSHQPLSRATWLPAKLYFKKHPSENTVNRTFLCIPFYQCLLEK